MPKEERKTHTSTEVKKRYNNKVYDRFTFSVPKQLSADFKAKCVEKRVSQAQVFKKAMEEFLKNE